MNDSFQTDRATLAAALLPLAAFVVTLSVAPLARAESLGGVLAEQAGADQAAIKSQQRIDEIHDATQEMVTRYRQALADTESISKYNEQLSAQVDSQTRTIGEMKGQLAEIENTHREVLPLMQKMVDTLDQFVKLDVPFVIEERTKRVAGLHSLLSRADVTSSEKYRRILEAYQIELDYGRTLEAYEGVISGVGGDKTVQFVRLGRISLMYQTLDGQETGYWDAATRKWVVDDTYAHDVEEALRVARKQGAPDLLMVPVPAASEVKS
jgi:hypothetical protein